MFSDAISGDVWPIIILVQLLFPVQSDYQYRYILIPGGTSARMAKSINWNDYKAVQAYLGLKD